MYEKEEYLMKKLAAIILAGVLAAGAFTTVNAAEFSDGTDTEREEYFAIKLIFQIRAQLVNNTLCTTNIQGT